MPIGKSDCSSVSKENLPSDFPRKRFFLAYFCKNWGCFQWSNILAWPIPSTDISKTWCVILKVLQYHRVANNRMFAQAYWRATKKSGNNIHQEAFLHVATASCWQKKSFDAICARMTLLYILSRTWILFSLYSKEYIERRHGESFEFLFLPKMGLLGSQASTRK